MESHKLCDFARKKDVVKLSSQPPIIFIERFAKRGLL